MSYSSYKDKALQALNKSKKDICEEIGSFITAEAQIREPVKTGNMRRSTTYEVMDGNKGVNVGVTKDAEYAPFVEKGTSKQKAQPFLEPAAMENLTKIEEIVIQKIRANMGGE